MVAVETVVDEGAGALVDAGAEMAGAGGAFVTCADKLPEIKTAKTNQIFFFIIVFALAPGSAEMPFSPGTGSANSDQ